MSLGVEAIVVVLSTVAVLIAPAGTTGCQMSTSLEQRSNMCRKSARKLSKTVSDVLGLTSKAILHTRR